MRLALILLFTLLTLHANAAAEDAPMATPSPTPVPNSLASTFSALHTFAAIDLFSPVGLANAQPDDDRFRVRAVEFTLSGALNNDLKAVINVAAFDEDGTDDGSNPEGGQISGNFLFQLNEAFVSSATLIPQTFVKVGKFYLDVGILNGEHQIDWPFPTAPYYHQVFFDKNNVVDTGVEGVWSTANHRFDIELGYTSGYDFGHPDTDTGSKPITPTSYIHPKWHSESGHLDVGLNFLDRDDDSGQQTELSGFDIKYRTTNDPMASSGWLVQNETFYRFQTPNGLPLTEEIGGYLYVQHNWTPKWSAGLRLDGYTMTSLKDIGGGNRRNLNYALVPVLDYRMSPTTHLRAAYNYDVAVLGGTADVGTQILEFQLVAEIGDIISLHD